jgi:hypothetical protein
MTHCRKIEGDEATMEHPFDEMGYLHANPDVAEAVKAGQFATGRQHYDLYGRSEGRDGAIDALAGRPAESPQAATPPASARASSDSPATPFIRFEERPPSAQASIDIFRGRWASDLSAVLGVDGTGNVPLFQGDDRPLLAAKAFGTDGRLEGMDVLELGPLEGGHTYQLERLGAKTITAVEASVEAFLKCLVVKETLGLQRSRFLLGDVVEYLAAGPGRFDLVFCSGILYHMPDPVALIRAISTVTDRCFVWTHYYDPTNHNLDHHARKHTVDGFTTTYWSHVYGDKSTAFWGGNKQEASWLEKSSLLAAFRHFGLEQIEVVRDDQAFVNGPNLMLCASRPGSRPRTG